jgi:nitrite reductase (NADH) small subunit
MTHPVRRPRKCTKSSNRCQSRSKASIGAARSCGLVTTEAFVPVGAAADIAPGSFKLVKFDGREVAVFNIGGTFYAIDDLCPHQGASLSAGWLDGTTITCPWHAWCFNVTDGTMTFAQFTRVDSFDVRVEDGQVSVSRTPRPEPPRGG